ncbi:glutaminase [Ammoniphilus sp. 3BR4]|uniref:glutaminase n=1 Tax=Ammoniphilus sp. 3BR4 TaxID=3158265 RepID=UPI0034650272
MEHRAQLREWIQQFRSYAKEGKVADYIPALQKANPDHLGICIIGSEGAKWGAGESEVPFTMQSISKIVSFMTACLAHGMEKVLKRVDVEPTGDAFDSIIRLEVHELGKPFNPMINAGALTIASILPGQMPEEKLDSVLVLLNNILGRRPDINMEVFESEWRTANRNRALAYYLMETGFLETSVEEALEVYLKHCSIEVTLEDLATIGLVLAHDGYHPLRGERILSKNIARLTKAIMLTCGMYNASGKFAAFVGLPAKSGVSGGIMCCMPPRLRSQEMPFRNGCGIGIYGPAIDEYGNSAAGVKLLQHLSDEWDFNIF